MRISDWGFRIEKNGPSRHPGTDLGFRIEKNGPCRHPGIDSGLGQSAICNLQSEIRNPKCLMGDFPLSRAEGIGS